MQTRLYIVHALTPMHPGVGSGAGLIDLPIARERSTNFPLVPGSSVKGVLRDVVRAQGDPDRVARVFGPDAERGELFPSAVRLSDARILLFPVRSDNGTFAWVTCPLALHRLQRDSGTLLDLGTVPGPSSEDAVVSAGSMLLSASGQAVLEGLPFTGTRQLGVLADRLAALVFPGAGPNTAWRAILVERLCVVHDDVFAWMVETATDVRARIRLNPETGIVDEGALWYEEALPAETVLSGLVQVVDNGQDADAWSAIEGAVAAPIQLGGNATVGHGMARIVLHGGAQ